MNELIFHYRLFLNINFEEIMRGSVVEQPAYDTRLYTSETRVYMYARPAEHDARDVNRYSRVCYSKSQNGKVISWAYRQCISSSTKV